MEENQNVVPTAAAAEENTQTAEKSLREALADLFSSLSEHDRATLLFALQAMLASERARAAQKERAEEEAVMAEMDTMPAFAGILSRAEAVRALISRLDWLRALPPRERLSAALYLDRGMRLREPTPAEKLESVLADPALLRALAEKQALSREAERATRPPAVKGASGGRMPARASKKPKSLDEAGEAAKHYFKIRK